MRLATLLIGTLIYIHLFIITFFSRGQSVNLSLFGKNTISLNSEVLFPVLALYATIATFLLCYSHIISLNQKLKKQFRNTEKASIVTQESADKIKNLQSKIDTLEIALKEALKK